MVMTDHARRAGLKQYASIQIEAKRKLMERQQAM